jgi:D-tyrosyl-tRNA(Tyr) deacylase
MRAVLQRVQQARVTVAGEVVGQIGAGWLVLLGVGSGDTSADAEWLAEKIVHLRGFPDENGKMNRDVQEVQGAILVVSQFTLYGDCRKGRRPSFTQAAEPAKAQTLYEAFVQALRAWGIPVATGRFAAHMHVELINDGPVTFILETPPRPTAGESPNTVSG